MKNKISIALSLAVILAVTLTSMGLAAELVTAEVTGTGNDVTVTQGTSVTSVINVSANGAIACTITSANPATATVDTLYSFDSVGVLTTGSSSAPMSFYSNGVPGGGSNNCGVTWSGASTPYSVTATFSAAATTPVGNYTVTLSSAAGTTDETNPSASGGKLGDTTATTITVHVVAPAVQNQTINVTTAAPASAAYGSSFDVIANATSGLPVSITTGGVCTGSGSGSATITMASGTGTCAVYYDQAGNASFNPAPQITSNTTAQKATATISVSGYSVTYDGAAHTVIGTATGVFSEDLSGLFDLSGTTHTDAGTYNGDPWSFAGDGNYDSAYGTVNDSIAQAPVTATAGGGSGTYDGSAQSPSACAVTGAYTGDLACANNPTSFGPDAGTYAVAPVVSGTGLGNFAITLVNGSYTIDKADANCIVNGYAGTYDGEPHGATGTCTGVNNEDLSTNLDLGASFTDVPGGTANWTFTGGTNYNDQANSVAITIDPAPVTATTGSGSGIYNGAAQSPSACAVTGAYTGDLTCANSPSSVGPEIGTFTISPIVSGTGLGNYAITPVNGSYTIDPAPVTATAGSGSGTYNGSAQSPAACAVTGAYTGDLSCTNNPASVGPDVGTYATSPVVNGTALSNFDITQADGSYTINPAPVIATAGSGTGTYNGLAQSPTACAVTGVYTGDLSCANAPSSIGPNAGTYAISPVVSGTGLSNFDISPVNGSYTINKANANCTVTGYNVYFDGLPHTATGSCTGVLGESLSGLNLTGTTHTAVGSYNDTWYFNDITGNYNDTSGTVSDTIAAWTIKGFFQPVDMGKLNIAKNGSTVPLKFEVFAGSTELTSTSIVQAFVQTESCLSLTPSTDDIESYSTGSTSLRYDSVAGQFIFNWQTPKRVGACYRVTLTTQDGSTIYADFRLK